MENNEEEVPVIDDPKAVLAALERAKADAKKYREDNDALRAEKETKAPADNYKERAIKADAKEALREKGVKNPERLLKHLKMDDLDYDEDGNIAGLEGRVAELKADFPELFSAKHSAGSIDQFNNEVPKKKPLTSSEIQAAQVLGKW